MCAERERRAYERWKGSLRVHQADLFNGGPRWAQAQGAAASQRRAELEAHFSDVSVTHSHACGAVAGQEGPQEGGIVPLQTRLVTYYGLNYTCSVKVRCVHAWPHGRTRAIVYRPLHQCLSRLN